MKQGAKYIRKKKTNVTIMDREIANEKNIKQGITIYYNVERLFPRPVKTAAQAFQVAKMLWSKELMNLQEQFMAIYLDPYKYVIGYRLICTGTMRMVPVDLKLICCLGIKLMAYGVIVIHNHPGGHNRPSKADKNITSNLQIAIQFHDIILLDHLIISKTGFYSFAENNKGWLK